MTFQPLLDGLTDFITVSELEIAEALRLYLEHTIKDPTPVLQTRLNPLIKVS